MDISSYISELLFEHDCVMVPGMGGFVCNYKPADIHPIHHTVAPPSKAITFNVNLNRNDGLLVNYIAHTQHLAFDAANEIVQEWVRSVQHSLQKNETVVLRKIGTLHLDVERNLQFTNENSVNYLKSSFGLPTITANPILRSRTIEFTEKFKKETKHQIPGKRVWSIAAALLLFVSMVGLAELMWMGVEVKQLNLDQAGVFHFLNRVFDTPEPALQPLPIEVDPAVTNENLPQTDTAVEMESIPNAETEAEAPAPEIREETNYYKETPKAEEHTEVPITTEKGLPVYYVVIGAFLEEANIEAAKQRLQQKFPDSVILVYKSGRLTKLGYSVGNQYSAAKQQLEQAQQEDSSYWLLKK